MTSDIIKELTLQLSTITEGVAALVIAIAVIEGMFRTLIVILQSFSPSDASSSHEEVRSLSRSRPGSGPRCPA